MPIEGTSYRPILERLYHYTSGAAALSIISGGSGKDKEICFWLKNAKSKNDAAELKLGSILTDRLKGYMKEHERASSLNEINIQPELVYINSFTEGEHVTDHMLEEYGNFRLEFDFRSSKCKNDIRECSYFREQNMDELVQYYCSIFDRDWPLISGATIDMNALSDYLMNGMSAVISIPLLKHQEEWETEKEWRHVFHQQPIDKRMFAMPDGTMRMKVYYPASTLTGITCFTSPKSKNKDLSFYYKIKRWVEKNGWNAQVKIIMDDYRASLGE